MSRNRQACPSGIFASISIPSRARCQSPKALSFFDSPDPKEYCSLTFRAAARIGHEIRHSWGKLDSRDRARSTREGTERSGHNVVAAPHPNCLSSGRTTYHGIPAAKLMPSRALCTHSLSPAPSRESADSRLQCSASNVRMSPPGFNPWGRSSPDGLCLKI